MYNEFQKQKIDNYENMELINKCFISCCTNKHRITKEQFISLEKIFTYTNNKNYFVVRTLSHSKDSDSDFVLYESPNPKIRNDRQFISSRKYIENSKQPFGRHYNDFRFSNKDNKRFKKWNKKNK